MSFGEILNKVSSVRGFLGKSEVEDSVGSLDDSFSRVFEYVKKTEKVATNPIVKKIIEKSKTGKKTISLLRVLCQVIAISQMGSPVYGDLMKALGESNTQVVNLNKERRKELKIVNDDESVKEREMETFLYNLSNLFSSFLNSIGFTREKFQEESNNKVLSPKYKAVRYAMSNVLIDYENLLTRKNFNAFSKDKYNKSFTEKLNETLGCDVDLKDVAYIENQRREKLGLTFQEFRSQSDYLEFQKELMLIYRNKEFKKIEELVEDTGLMKNYEILDCIDVAQKLGMEKEINEAVTFFSDDKKLDDAISMLVSGTY